MTFLERRLHDKFTWPRRPDISCIDRRYVFMGPLKVKGSLPFTFPELKGIKEKFNALKKH
jgi:hypothetical protein